MAFKMKGFPMHNTSALKNVGKGAAFQHYVDDNREHQETYGDHSDDLQTEEEHEADKNKGKKKEDLSTERADAPVEDTPMAQTKSKDPTIYKKSGWTKEEIEAYKHKYRNIANKPKDYYTVIAGLTPR